MNNIDYKKRLVEASELLARLKKYKMPSWMIRNQEALVAEYDRLVKEEKEKEERGK